MKTAIFYFTGTGNSLQIGRRLARLLGESELVSIPKVINQPLDTQAERLGIIFPVYAFGVPLLVRDFIAKCQLNSNKYIFAIATYAGNSGDALGQVSRLLKSKGLRLSAGFTIRMPNNYIPFSQPSLPQEQKEILEQAIRKVEDAARLIKNESEYIKREGFFAANWIFSGIYYFLISQFPALDRKFWVNKNCISCGICRKLCPVGNIEIIRGTPRWLHKCQQCFACFNWCPTVAIQYGFNTVGRQRYRNPSVIIRELYMR